MLGLSPARLRAYVKAGLLCPQRGEGGQLRFSFQDLLLLRTAEGLVTARLPPRRVRDALRKLRRRLPASQPLSGIHLETDGGRVVVFEGDRSWCADSGQILMSFQPQGQPSDTTAAPIALRPRAVSEERASPAPPQELEPPTADDLYQLACNLEDTAPDMARVAYERTLGLDPERVDAHVNLGRLLHEAGDFTNAEEHYRAALARQPDDVTALYNLGVLLEDRHRADAALPLYERAAVLDPAHADAHFNAARLHDLAGHYEAALRHLREYRNLTSG
jgi:tetratricopeptide (TPR) repeat protein